jgi:DNA-binding XRE family transcriptional regulator
MNTVKADDLHAENMAHDQGYREAYEALEGEFSMINALIEARTRAKLTQAEVASRMGTTESAISRLESGRVKPSTRTLERYAQATGHKLQIRLEPALTR